VEFIAVLVTSYFRYQRIHLNTYGNLPFVSITRVALVIPHDTGCLKKQGDTRWYFPVNEYMLLEAQISLALSALFYYGRSAPSAWVTCTGTARTASRG
jgi:hypothetical protein